MGNSPQNIHGYTDIFYSATSVVRPLPVMHIACETAALTT